MASPPPASGPKPGDRFLLESFDETEGVHIKDWYVVDMVELSGEDPMFWASAETGLPAAGRWPVSMWAELSRG